MSVGAAEVLAALRHARGGLRSGEDLSRELGVSRAAVWKHIEALRRHIIEAHTPVEEVGQVAADAGVGKLVLNHFVPSDPARAR